MFLVRYHYSCPSNRTLANSGGQFIVTKTDTNIVAADSSLIKELGRVNNSRNMKEFLENHIRWQVGIYSHDESKTLYDKANKSNNLIFSRICASCDDPNQDDDSNDGLLVFHVGYYFIAIIPIGLVSLLGNGITAIHEIKKVISLKTNEAKERKVYNVLVLNLCISDSLMGLYLTLGPIAFRFSDQEVMNTNLCNALGVTSVLSMQASVSIIVIITAYRLFGVLFPYKRIHIKTTVILLVLVWLLWFVVLTLPLLSETLLAHQFTQTIVLNKHNGNRTIIDLPRFIKNIQNLARSMNSTDDLFGHVLDAVSKYESNEVAVQLLQSFDLVDFERDEMSFVNYYYFASGCTFITFVEEARNPKARTYFSLFFLIFNLVEYVFILIAYLIMFKKISATRFMNLLPCVSQKTYFRTRGQQTQKIKNENKQVYARIFAVVATDLICGIPICLLGLAYFFEGLYVTECFRNLSFINVASLVVLVLFPLNSIINPYIYSLHLRKNLFNRCKKQFAGSSLSKGDSAGI